MAYSSDGSRLACGAMDGSVAVFDTATGNTIGVLEGHYKPVRSLTFMPGREREIEGGRTSLGIGL